MSFGVGSPLGSSMREATNGRLQTQQPIFFNAQVALSMGDWRRQTIEDKEIPDNRKFTTVLSTGKGDMYDLLHIIPFDPSFYYNNQSKTLPRDSYTEARVNIFQSLNGLEIPREVGNSQEAFEDMFLYGGQPNRAIFFGKAGQPATGVATMVAGSKGAWNYGHDTWYGLCLTISPLYWDTQVPGDKLAWRMPSINPVDREEERKRLPSNLEHPAMRDRAIIEVLTFDKAHHFLRDALTRSFESDKSGYYNFTRLVPGNDEHLGGVDRSIIALRNFLQLHSFHTVAMMLAYGLDPSRVPGNGVDPFDPANYNANVGLEALDLTAVLKKVPVLLNRQVVVGGGAIQDSGQNGVPQQTMEQAQLELFSNKLLFWAGKFGLLGPSVPEYIKPFTHLVNQTIGLTMRPWILNKSVHDYFSILRFFPDKMKQGASFRRRNPSDLSRSYNLRDPVGSLAYCQGSLAKDFSAALGFAIEKRMARVMFHSLNLTPPGEFGDVWR